MRNWLGAQRLRGVRAARGAGLAGHHAPRTTHHQCGGRRRGRRAWPGFEPTRRAKLAARTASGRAGPTVPGTPVAQPAQTPATQPARTPVPSQQEHRWHEKARRRARASGPLHKPHFSLMRSSHVRRSPTRMPKSRFWSAIAASVAGFLMRAASTSGAAVMAPTP